MDEEAACWGYSNLIDEVFIQPIRSVLIVDDQYPTIEEHIFVAEYSSEQREDPAISKKFLQYQEKSWRSSPQKVTSVIKYFRDRKWIVDFHDGHCLNPEQFKNIIGHLHQSDLLILDYQLDGKFKGGEKCIAAIEHLSCNSQFNLVVIHTDHEFPNEVFIEVLFSLLPPSPAFGAFAEIGAKVKSLLELWEDDDENILVDIRATIDSSLYLRARRSFREVLAGVCKRDSKYFHRFISLYDQKPAGIKMGIVDLFKWLIWDFERGNIDRLCKREGVVEPTWCMGETGKNWIRTDKVFVTVSSKGVNPDLTADLIQALNAWKPLPPRLVLGKIRSELGKMGVVAEDSFLRNRDLQAAWYHNLLSCTGDGVRTGIQKTIQEYWQGISGGLENGLIEFTSNLLKAEEDGGRSPTEIVKEHFNVDYDIDEERVAAVLRLNVQSCSVKPYGWHLATGHILKLENDFWLCLTPACDLIPEQKCGGRFKRMEKAMPFRAVQLRPYGNPKEALKSVNSNLELFIELDNKVVAFGFLPPPSNSPEIAPNPVWDELFAKNHGRLPTAGKLEVQVGRLQWNDWGSGSLAAHWITGEVVGQLRYEYAINLMQRLSFTLSRVGLDFIQ